MTVDMKLTSRPSVQNLILKMDSGAQGITLPLATFRKMLPDKLDSRWLTTAGDHQSCQ